MIVLRGLYVVAIVALGALGLLAHASIPPWAWAVYGAAALAFGIGVAGRTNWPFPLLVLLAAIGLCVPDLQGFDPRARFWEALPGQRLLAHAGIAVVSLVLVIEGAVRARRILRTKQRLGLKR